MKKTLLFLVASLSCFISFGQLTAGDSDGVLISFDSTDFGTLELNDNTYMNVTVTNNFNWKIDVTVGTIGFNNTLMPFFNTANTVYCEAPNESGSTFSGFKVRLDSSSEELNSITLSLVSGASQTIQVGFEPKAFQFSRNIGESLVCVEFEEFSGQCLFMDVVPRCAGFSSTGIGQYSNSIGFTYSNRAYVSSGCTVCPNYSGTIYQAFTGNSIEPSPIGLFDFIEKESLQIYPNPATSSVFVAKGEVNFYDALGNLVLTTESNGQVDVSSLEPGLYIVSQNGYSARLIVE